MSGILRSVTEAIGSTPLVSLDRLTAGVKGRIMAKLEYLNPGFSKKDRAALRIIEEAERAGALRSGQTVVELTSGNMGTGLSIVCKSRGYPFVAVMSAGNSSERARMMRALGAEVQTGPGGITARASRLYGARIDLPYPSVGATETVLLTAVRAEGKTVLRNAATEPEVV